MQAVVVDHGELRLEERPDPVPGDTEVLVAVRAAGLNGADMLQLRGLYAAPPGSPPDIPGLEVAGEVVGTGRQVTATQRGDRVMALVGGGAQATMAVVDESHLLAVPTSVPWPEAGGFPEVFTTAYDALFTRCGLSVGDRLLVTGAAGGVGAAAVRATTFANAPMQAFVVLRARRSPKSSYPHRRRAHSRDHNPERSQRQSNLDTSFDNGDEPTGPLTGAQ